MRSQHQQSDIGSILERDWVTTNGLNVLRFGNGRKIWYNSGNFVFTTANIPNYHKKHKLSTETTKWGWNDCKTADGTVNSIVPSFNTTDLRDYAYYGSCVELIRSTIEEVISDFPGRLKTTTEKIYSQDSKEFIGYYLNNPFQIDLHHKRVNLDKYDNPMRYMSHSWAKYCIKIYLDETINEEVCGYEGNIIGYTIEDKEESECISDNEYKILKVITFETDNEDIQYVTVYGYYINGEIIYIYKPFADKETVIIQPQQEYIDDYFNNLYGFKKQLLRRDTKPLYSNNFITPTEYNLTWYYPVKNHIWPSDGYCVIIDSMSFSAFLSDLYDIGQAFDDLWSDNLYRSMTHESIKNFDWTYSRDYYEGDEQDNIDGGERMQKIIRVFGRVFDDIKVYMDTIKLTPNITYDKYKNCPEGLLSEINESGGFDIKTIIGDGFNIDSNVTSDFLESENVTKDNYWVSLPYNNKQYSLQSTLGKWFANRNSTDIYADVANNEFMRRLQLSSKRIMQTKGTQEAIEMVFGLFGFGKGEDYTLTEEAYYTEKLIRSDECIDGSIDNVDVGEDWSDTLGVDWKEINSRKKGDLAVEINNAKDLELLYSEDYLSGTPLREVYLGRENTPYILPYYDSTQLYDDDLIFQGKGGWGKMIKNDDSDLLDDAFDYQETLSYLHVVGTIGELLVINPNVVSNNDIYYVTNLSDYTDYDENPPMNIEKGVTMSHYFILIDSNNPQEMYSWKNIVVKPSLDENGNLVKVDNKTDFESVFGCISHEVDLRNWKFEPDDDNTETDDEKLSTYKYAFKKMQYLDSIFSTNIGNNPHVGYGTYDDGLKYIEYMKLPFKYLIDNVNLLYQNNSLLQIAKKFKFDDINGAIIEEDFTPENDTCSDGFNIGDTISNTTYNSLTIEEQGKCKQLKVYDKIQIMNSRNKDNNVSDFVKYISEKDAIQKTNVLNDDEHNVEKRWYINTKVLTIENKVKDESPKQFFNSYFKTTIMPYIMQVIPSTTILKLKGFS